MVWGRVEYKPHNVSTDDLHLPASISVNQNNYYHNCLVDSDEHGDPRVQEKQWFPECGTGVPERGHTRCIRGGATFGKPRDAQGDNLPATPASNAVNNDNCYHVCLVHSTEHGETSAGQRRCGRWSCNPDGAPAPCQHRPRRGNHMGDIRQRRYWDNGNATNNRRTKGS